MPPLEICRPGPGPLWPVRKYGYGPPHLCPNPAPYFVSTHIIVVVRYEIDSRSDNKFTSHILVFFVLNSKTPSSNLTLLLSSYFSTQSCHIRGFLGVFAKLPKATISFFMFVLPSVFPHGTTRLPLDSFSWNLTFEYFSKNCSWSSSFIKNR